MPSATKMSTGQKIFRTLVRPLQKLPLGFHYAACRAISWTVQNVVRYRRDVVMVNLSRSFPQAKWKEVRQMSRDFYRHFGDIFAEAMWFGACRGNVQRLRDAGLCRTAGSEELLASHASSPNTMVLTSHLGNWEIMGGLLEYLPDGHGVDKEDIVIVYKKLSNGFWDEFIGYNRAAVLPDWDGYQESRDILRYALKHREDRKIYFFIGDQYPYSGSARHKVPDFMHQETWSMNGGAALAAKLHMPVFYYGMNRVGRGRYEMKFTKICDDASTMDPDDIMAEFYRLLEIDVNADPGNYLWSHNRWK